MYLYITYVGAHRGHKSAGNALETGVTNARATIWVPRLHPDHLEELSVSLTLSRGVGAMEPLRVAMCRKGGPEKRMMGEWFTVTSTDLVILDPRMPSVKPAY